MVHEVPLSPDPLLLNLFLEGLICQILYWVGGAKEITKRSQSYDTMFEKSTAAAVHGEWLSASASC